MLKTSNAQPALMAVSIAHKINEDELEKISNFVEVVLGHCLENTRRFAINSIDLKSTARILRTRGNAMQDSVKVFKQECCCNRFRYKKN